jgi:hypothetical protein
VPGQPAHLSEHAIHSILDSPESGNAAFLALDVLHERTEHTESLSTAGSAAKVDLVLMPWAREVLVQRVQAAVGVVAKIALKSIPIPRGGGGDVLDG